MKNIYFFSRTLFQKIFELNSNNKVGSNTIAVFTFILYKCEELKKEIVLSDYEIARELGLSEYSAVNYTTIPRQSAPFIPRQSAPLKCII